jgi:hypothetical protein
MRFSVWSTIFVVSAVTAFTSAADFDQMYKEVCSYDNYCRRLKSSDGAWFQPKGETMAFIRDPRAQAELKAAAAKYGVDPVAVAGSIVAENSLNVSLATTTNSGAAHYALKDWLTRNGIYSVGGKSIGFGVGEIHLDTAMEADAHMAAIEHRAPLNTSEMAAEINNPLGSIRVAAMIVRQVQDDYKAQGFDISRNPGLLATVYNLGKSREKAALAKKNGSLPRLNYFGLFVSKYSGDIRAATTPKVVSVIPASLTARVPLSTAIPPRGSHSSANAHTVELKVPQVMVDIVTDNLPLTGSPLLCDKVGNNDSQRETKSTSFGAPVGAIAKGQAFTEIGRSLDCNSDSWRLIRSATGTEGWIRESDLTAAAGSAMVAKSPVCTAGDTACIAAITKALDKSVITDTNKQSGPSIIYAAPFSSLKPGGFDREDFRCQAANDVEVAGSGSGYHPVNGVNTGQSSIASINKNSTGAADAEKRGHEAVEFANAELSRMSKSLKIAPDKLRDLGNPYAIIAKSLGALRDGGNDCLASVQSDSPGCSNLPYVFSDLKKLLETLKYETKPNLAVISGLRYESGVQNALNLPRMSAYNSGGEQFAAYVPTDAEIGKFSPTDIQNLVQDCQTRVEKLEKAAATVSATAKAGAPQTGTGWPNPYGSTSYNGPTNNYPSGSFPAYGSAYNADDIFTAAKQATSAQLKQYAPEFISFAKYCHANLNLIKVDKVRQNSIECSQAPKFLTINNQLLSRELWAAVKDAPANISNEILKNSSLFVPSTVTDDILKRLPPKVLGYSDDTDMAPQGSYCPNKTAEVIHELLDKNPCIKHVYVPTRFLTNKLGTKDKRVLYREFETTDRYAIEVGEGKCK